MTFHNKTPAMAALHILQANCSQIKTKNKMMTNYMNAKKNNINIRNTEN